MQGILTLDDSQFTSRLSSARGGLSNLGSGLQSAGTRITRFGIGASLALAPVTLALRSSVNAYRDFEEAMVNAQAILGATTEDMALLNDEILAIGGASRAGPQQAAEAYFTIVSGVANATTHIDILSSSVALSEAGLADLSVTTEGMVAVMNAYRFEAEDAAFVSDVFTRTVQKGVGTMDEFVGAMAPLASLSNELGIGFDELGGATALLTASGKTASESATQLQSVMVAFLKPNQNMTDALELMGFESGQAAIATLGLQGAVDALSTALDDDVGKLTQALGRTEALQGALVLAGDGAEQFMNDFKDGAEGATVAAQLLQNATDAAKVDFFKSKMEELSIVMGEQLSNALADVQKKLTPLIEDTIVWAKENPERVKDIIMMAGALVLLAGGLIIAGGLVTMLGTALIALTSPFIIAGALVLGGIYLLDELAKALGFEGVIDMFDRGLKAAGQLVVIFAIGVTKVFVEIVRVIREAMRRAADIVRFAVEGMTSTINSVGSGIFGFGALGIPTGMATPVETKAVGGDFMAGQRMLVGEEGPELVQFPHAGTVIPNDQLGGGDTFHITVIANDEAGGRAAGRSLKAELHTILERNG